MICRVQIRAPKVQIRVQIRVARRYPANHVICNDLQLICKVQISGPRVQIS